MPPKKPKLTPEERKALRIQKRIDKKLKQAEAKRQHKRDHLEREVKIGNLTIRRYEKNWRDMLIKVALPRMRAELEFAWHNFERVVDSKDFTVSLLMDELQDEETQYMRNFRHHVESLEKLLGGFRDRTEELHEDYTNWVQRLQDMGDEEAGNIKAGSNDNAEYLKTMLFRLDMARKEHDRMIRAEYYSKLDEVEVKCQLTVQKLKATLEKKYQIIFEDTTNFIDNYNKQIHDRRKEHDELKEQEDTMQGLIGQQFNKLKKCTDRIRALRQRFNDLRQIEDYKILDLEAERHYFSNAFLELKTKLANDSRHDLDQLKCLSQVSRQVFDFLERLIKKGETLLTIAGICRKFETFKEKLMPFPSATRGCVKEQFNVRREEEEDEAPVRKEMELFWQRVGQASGVRTEIAKERRFLRGENDIFLDAYDDFCDDLKYPQVRVYKPRATIAKIDAVREMRKYAVYESGSLI